MSKLQEIAIQRLNELDLGPVEAAVKAGLERTFLRDLVDGKKSTVTLKKMPELARALQLDADALMRGEVVRLNHPDDGAAPTATKPNASFLHGFRNSRATATFRFWGSPSAAQMAASS